MISNKKSSSSAIVIEGLEDRRLLSAAPISHHPKVGKGIVLHEIVNQHTATTINVVHPISTSDFGSLGSVKLAGETDSLTAMINWGNGINTSGGVYASDGSNFNVADVASGYDSEVYTKAGTFKITADVIDGNTGATVAVIHSHAMIEKNLTAGKTIHTVAAKTFDKLLGVFNTTQTKDYIAGYFSVDWGDQTVATGVKVKVNGNEFQIYGSHQYSTPGTYTVVVSYQPPPDSPLNDYYLPNPVVFSGTAVVAPSA